MKECAYCGEEFKGKGVVVNGETFCSEECAQSFADEQGYDDQEDDDYDIDDE